MNQYITGAVIKQLADSKAAVGVEYCNERFCLEKEFAGLPPDERQRQRHEKSKPVLDAFYAWLSAFKTSGGTALLKSCRIYGQLQEDAVCVS